MPAAPSQLCTSFEDQQPGCIADRQPATRHSRTWTVILSTLCAIRLPSTYCTGSQHRSSHSAKLPCPAGGPTARGGAVPEARRPHRARRCVGRRAAVPHPGCTDVRVPSRRRQGAGPESAPDPAPGLHFVYTVQSAVPGPRGGGMCPSQGACSSVECCNVLAASHLWRIPSFCLTLQFCQGTSADEYRDCKHVLGA
jgi:hypothetical protein